MQLCLSQYPNAHVRLEYLHPSRVYDAVENDQADLGLVSYPKPSRTIKAISWRQEPMVLACAPGHRFAKRGRVLVEDVAGEPIVGFDADLTIRPEIDRVLLQYRDDLNVVMEFDNIETIKRAVEIDAGVSLLPAPTVAREVEAGTLAAVPLATNLVRPLGIIHRRGRDLGVTARRFIELLRSEGNALGALSGKSAWEADDHRTATSTVAAAQANGNGHGARDGTGELITSAVAAG